MAKLAHSMIRLIDKDASVAFCCTAFGLEIGDRLDVEDLALIHMALPTGPFELEPTDNKARTTPDDLGEGYGRIAIVVDDLETARAATEQALSVRGFL